MFLTVTVEANVKTLRHWKTLASYIPNTTVTLIRMRFGFVQYAPVKPSSFYAEGIYGFHPSFLEKLRIDEITIIPPNHPQYNEFLLIKKHTAPPSKQEPLIFSLFIITIPIDFAQSKSIIHETQFPSISTRDQSKNPLFFWEPTMQKIYRKSHRRAREMWRHCTNVYAYDWLVFFTEDVSVNYKSLHPIHRQYWQTLQYEIHNFTFSQMMRLLYRYLLSKERHIEQRHMKTFIPIQSFVHHHKDLLDKPDKLLRKLIDKYNLNEYSKENTEYK